ncbi:hypothetical protein LC612_28050 [Nostoc sp. CHAB 5834]|nr:hypothetical protein [Nostoc sp. CHAB 5834]
MLAINLREKPKGLAAKEGNDLPIRSISLTGLKTAKAQNIFQHKEKLMMKREFNVIIERHADGYFVASVPNLNSKIHWTLLVLGESQLRYESITKRHRKGSYCSP